MLVLILTHAELVTSSTSCQNRVWLSFRFFTELSKQFGSIELQALYFLFQIFDIVFNDVKSFCEIPIVFNVNLDQQWPLLGLLS